MTNNDNDDTTGRRPTQERLAAALDLAEQRDWYVFLAPASGEKKGKKSGKYSNRRRWANTKDPDQIRRDFTRWPDANIGVPTGIDNRIFVLEVDTLEGHKVDGLASFKQLETDTGILPVTLNSESPTRSVHYFFNYPDNLSGKIKVINKPLDKKRYPGIDIKGDGGMILAPPSVRPGVGVYKWLNDNEIADAPTWLLDMVIERVVERPPVNRPPDNTIGPNAVLVPGLLDEIDPNDLDRSERFQVGCAVFAEVGEQGREVFQQWRSRGGKYDAREAGRRWNDIVDRSHGYNCSYTTLERIHDKVTETDEVRAAMLMVQRNVDKIISNAKQQRPPAVAPAIIKATPVIWRDPSQIPQREWLYYPYYIRGSVTGTAASGGTGKSTLGISETMSMASGLPLLGTEPASQLRVWYWNGEETEAELERKLAAVRILHDLTPEDFGNRLFVNSGLLMPIVIAETLRGDTKICQPVVDQVTATLKENQIDVLILDPFVSTRRVSEQDNDDIDMVVKKWMAIAVAANCAIHIFGHTRKNLNEYVTADDARGASAFKDALRCLRVLNPMTGKEAEKADIDEDERGFYFRADNGKKNLTPVASAHWYRLQSVNLGNGLIRIPGVPTVGDAVGVATPWEYPSLGDDIGPEQIKLGLEAVASGGPWRLDQRSKAQPWVGVPIAKALGFDLEKMIDKGTVVNLIKKWIKAGWLAKVPGQDPYGKDRDYVEVVR